MQPLYSRARRWPKMAAAIFLVCATLPVWAAQMPVVLPHAPTKPVKLLVFGDSLAAGYGLPQGKGFQARLGAALAADGLVVQILDGGVSGDTTAGGRARLDWALADKPDAAIVELGGNDGLRGLDPKETQANLAAILDQLAAAHVRVLLTGMEAPPNLGDAYTAQFRAVFTELGKRPDILFDPFFLVGVAADPALNQADGIHPNAAGVQRIVKRMLSQIETLLRATATGRARPITPG